MSCTSVSAAAQTSSSETGSTRSKTLRRTRFVCISDTHNSTFKLPKGDVLIHAGDLTNQGSYSELSKTVDWLEEADFEAKIVVAGNHDITLDAPFYDQYGLHFHSQSPQLPTECLSLLTTSPSITYLCHSSTTIRLRAPMGPRTTFSIFGSPFSPHLAQGPRPSWAFGYSSPLAQPAGPPADLPSLWDDMPLPADVVVTHTPARGHCDKNGERGAAGCEALRRALWRVRPRLAVCGHVHEGRGVERVRWSLRMGNATFSEEGVEEWTDPGAGGSKLSLVDLTGRKGGRALDNDGSHPCGDDADMSTGAVSRAGDQGDGRGQQQPSSAQLPDVSRPNSGTPGVGENPNSVPCAQVALAGRLGRQETCIVNCAIMANSYPHRGGKRFNKPVVVDIDLPVWTEE